MLSRQTWRKVGPGLAASLLLAAGLAAGLAFRGEDAQADVRRQPPEQHFQSGGQRSVKILQEIAASLKSIDARLERMQKLAERNLADQQQRAAEERRR